jgi:hypothetical protein
MFFAFLELKLQPKKSFVLPFSNQINNTSKKTASRRRMRGLRSFNPFKCADEETDFRSCRDFRSERISWMQGERLDERRGLEQRCSTLLASY